MTASFQIERLRNYVVGYKPPPGRPHHVYEHSSDGLLVTGYEDGSGWLVSPFGRQTHGSVIHERPDWGWAISADRRDYHRSHLYILHFPSRSFRMVTGLALTRDFSIVPYDGDRLVVLCPPAAEPKSDVRDLVVIDIASAQIADRFVLKGISHFFFGPVGCGPDGRIVINASRLGERNERLYIQGIARIHPLTREMTFEVFSRDKTGLPRISPSGQYVLRASKSVRPVAPSLSHQREAAVSGAEHDLYERSIEVWAGHPLCLVRTLPLEWASTGDAWEIPLPGSVRLMWQPDEAAFWWVDGRRAICVGMDGTTSRPIGFDTNRFYTFTALPGRAAEAKGERETTFEIIRLDGSPSEDLSPVDAPPPAVITPSEADVKRHKSAQAALKKLVNEKSDLRFTVKSSDAQDIVAAIDALTAALDKGLAWFCDQERRIKLTLKIGGVTYDEDRFFAHVETLGMVAVPALARLITKCRNDPDFVDIWSGELEDGRQAFGAAVKALGGIDPGAWIDLAAYEMCIDDDHESYVRTEVIPHFVSTHGWREESFLLALADIVQIRKNLGDDFTCAWRRSGLAAAAEAAHAPTAFAGLMLRISERMRLSALGTFAKFAAAAATAPAPAFGWVNYDRLFAQIKTSLTPWEAQLFEALKLTSNA
jgi:hypothetical protein